MTLNIFFIITYEPRFGVSAPHFPILLSGRQKNTITTKLSGDCGARELSFTAAENAKWNISTSEESLTVSNKTIHNTLHKIQPSGLAGTYLKELKTYMYTKTYTQMLIAAFYSKLSKLPNNTRFFSK